MIYIVALDGAAGPIVAYSMLKKITFIEVDIM